jgi:hypothetical protein
MIRGTAFLEESRVTLIDREASTRVLCIIGAPGGRFRSSMLTKKLSVEQHFNPTFSTSQSQCCRPFVAYFTYDNQMRHA